MNEPREIDKCCQTLCNKHAVIKQIEELEAENSMLAGALIEAMAWNWRQYGDEIDIPESVVDMCVSALRAAKSIPQIKKPY